MSSGSAPAGNSFSALSIVEQWIDCDPPFSFYFDFVGSYWKTPHGRALPLHRICTLARKQGVRTVLVESAHSRLDVTDEIAALDESYGNGGAAEAVQLTFLRTEASQNDTTEIKNQDVIGQAVLINYKKPQEADFSSTYIYEAVFRIPAFEIGSSGEVPLLNNYIAYERTFDVHFAGTKFQISGIYYCQQNAKTHVCAHACLRMALNTLGSSPHIDIRDINKTLGGSDPSQGLTIKDIADFIQSSGLSEPTIISCAQLNPDNYLSVVNSFVQSGMPALLVFTTGIAGNPDPVEHVVCVFGYTQNTDEWHPQAIPAYAGPSSAFYRQSSLWSDHLLVHDDNFGPYYTLSSRALEVDPHVKAKWVIGLTPRSIANFSVLAEVIASAALTNFLPALSSIGNNKWLSYITSSSYQFILRPILIGREEYIQHLQNSRAHDGSAATAQDVSNLAGLPDLFWMVEFSLPALFTGNHSKLGEVIVDAFSPINSADIFQSTFYIRMPGLLLTTNGPGQGQIENFSIQSHFPTFHIKQSNHRW
ncbi:C39 family peptidase [Methylorubrum extorquens]|uniref:Peptidase C39-like domain-containing protein n=1 Tax=Methylorubrum extorquens DSM 13060 TaxID=882800 RepID=H1KHR3_METEX|nr:C39 family peptidase [Methylorubrum extorquens]EHP92941.1 hypothetical protein MetexDRAFT_2175 [Methylorubrum extorquens DSM 13060]